MLQGVSNKMNPILHAETISTGLLFPMADEELKEGAINDEVKSERRDGIDERSAEDGVKRQGHEQRRPRIQPMVE